jgi:PAS domain S-box-containing protein
MLRQHGFDRTSEGSSMANESDHSADAGTNPDIAALKQLHQISTRLIQADDVESLYREIVDAAIAVTHADMGSIQLFDAERNSLRLLAWKGFAPESADFWGLIPIDSAHASICAAAVRAAARVIVADVMALPSVIGTRDHDAFAASGIRAVQSTPLITRSSRLLGMFSTHWRRPHEPTEDELRLLDILARQAADLIERTLQESALRQSEDRLRRVLETDAVGVLFFDERTGTLIDANDAFLRMSGYSREQVDARELTWQVMTPPEYVEVSREQMQRLALVGRIGPYEKEYFHRDGSRRWMMFSGARLGDDTVVEFAIDISEREELRHAGRRKDEFLAALSHELAIRWRPYAWRCTSSLPPRMPASGTEPWVCWIIS